MMIMPDDNEEDYVFMSMLIHLHSSWTTPFNNRHEESAGRVRAMCILISQRASFMDGPRMTHWQSLVILCQSFELLLMMPDRADYWLDADGTYFLVDYPNSLVLLSYLMHDEPITSKHIMRGLQVTIAYAYRPTQSSSQYAGFFPSGKNVNELGLFM